MKKMKRIVSVFLCIALIATAFGVSAPVQATKNNVKTKNVKLEAKKGKKGKKKNKKAKLASKLMEIYYSPYANSKKLSDCHSLVKDYVQNAKKKGKYTAKISNKKVAKVAKDSKKRQYIYSKKTGKTKAKIYEKLKKHKKRYLGKITIKIRKDDMASTVASMLNDTDYKDFRNVFIKSHLGQSTLNLDNKIKNFLVGNKKFGSKFKATDYTTKYKLEWGGDKFSLSDKGIISGIKNGSGEVTGDMTFRDGSTIGVNPQVHVFGYAINKVPGYSLDTIRNYVIGIDKTYKVEDGSMKQAIGFNNAATTPVLQYVKDTIDDEMEQYAAIERSNSQKSKHSTDVYNNTRDKVLEFLKADPAKHTCFYTQSTTDGLNKLASALVKSKKDIVLSTRIEHHSNDLSWRERCKVKYAEVDKLGRVKYNDLKKILKKYNKKKKKKKIKIVSITAASNVTGYVTNVHKIAKLAHKYGAKIVVDGAQIVAHRQFSMVGDVKDPKDDIDFFAFSAHKMYAPEGGGAVVGLTKELNKHQPMFYGGGTIKVVGDNWVVWKKAPEVYEAGSPNYEGVVGMGAAIDVLSTVGLNNIQSHEQVLIRKMIDGLKKLNKVILYGDTVNISDKVGVVTFNFHDINTEYVAQKLAEIRAIDTRRGAFCAHPYVWRLMGISDKTAKGFESCTDANTAGMVRVSFGIYNNEAEVDEFFKVMPEVMDKARKLTQENPVEPEY